MALTDQEFREEFKPIHVPADYLKDDTLDNKIIFALAQIGEGSSTDVVEKLKELENGIIDDRILIKIRAFLKDRFDKGLLNGSSQNGRNYYNLNKITIENKGSVDPDLLAPGLD